MNLMPKGFLNNDMLRTGESYSHLFTQPKKQHMRYLSTSNLKSLRTPPPIFLYLATILAHIFSDKDQEKIYRIIYRTIPTPIIGPPPSFILAQVQIYKYIYIYIYIYFWKLCDFCPFCMGYIRPSSCIRPFPNSLRMEGTGYKPLRQYDR
jgi:hypothetical protein